MHYDWGTGGGLESIDEIGAAPAVLFRSILSLSGQSIKYSANNADDRNDIESILSVLPHGAVQRMYGMSKFLYR